MSGEGRGQQGRETVRDESARVVEPFRGQPGGQGGADGVGVRAAFQPGRDGRGEPSYVPLREGEPRVRGA
ncbi:hypothetical protein ACFWIA_03345 [Streptomyces sp. NPDC127068]|uniref:hypothetical protein n=1 Tax=Streptomyces sp. NPDC127068 TaxID=3347127 RepID=UPI0036666D69